MTGQAIAPQSKKVKLVRTIREWEVQLKDETVVAMQCVTSFSFQQKFLSVFAWVIVFIITDTHRSIPLFYL